MSNFLLVAVVGGGGVGAGGLGVLLYMRQLDDINVPNISYKPL